MKQLAIVSGKGGTGKTTIATAISSILNNKVMADCDVEAANLNILLKGKKIKASNFKGKEIAAIDYSECNYCGICEDVCRFDAIKNIKVNPYKCEGCGLCTLKCPLDAIKMKWVETGEIVVSEIENGQLCEAQLRPGADGSGKLVTEVRKMAISIGEKPEWVIIDGPPGIGCPVIASITGVDAVLVVVEPTLSGFEDMQRVIDVIRDIGCKTFVCINKWNINFRVSQNIMSFCESRGIPVAGKIYYDEQVINALKETKGISEFNDSETYKEIARMWEYIEKHI
ncbi:ATP-binding protein [Calorimonas adulescens]|uniref:AAA family ATPase n=1 Tax=Calorimonas adulescens TaxID=2606906 RepID=A0A5D8Q994_9THEO|nr:ATP-binding protein [Calorimonas adulescens]TZE80947.1 AAA family ATPase [Calorimonas adulescens]